MANVPDRLRILPWVPSGLRSKRTNMSSLEQESAVEKSPQSCAEQDPGNETDIHPSVDQSSNFKSPNCTKSFIRKNELNAHIHVAAKHEKKSFTCPKCQKAFAYKTNAKRHEYKCNGTKQPSKEKPPNKGKGIKCRKCDHVSHNKRK
uniref:C2H2-type domain-containing protein n=1 Tax=Magallana gigas TaxID=29159 RepID=A0A8W8HKR7_MAGGI